jgi:multidrug efflux pump subunit AcrA (membrane-fusion protein)
MTRTLALLLSLGLFSISAVGCRDDAAPSDPTGVGNQAEPLYTCGMHPNVVQHGPGTCPICGMDLTAVGGGTQASGGATSPAAPGSGAAPHMRKIKYWVAPMDPTFISTEPGKSPMGMDLVPVYEDDAATSDSKSITIDPVVVQNMGVRVERATRQALFRHIRTIGEVEVGEDEVSVVNLRFSGWVEKIHVDKTGEPVEKGQNLFEIYSPELVSAQDEYLLALRRQGPKSQLARSARRRLELWNLDSADIDAIAQSGTVRRVIPIRAPRTGFILNKSIVEGAHVREGMDLYRIGDLSRIWVTAEVYEYDAPWVESGQPAQMELTHEPGKVIEGEVAYVYPTLDKSSRTLSVRLEFANPDYRLKPGMFATVYIQFRRKNDVVAIPTESIIHSGIRQLVFVSSGDGRFDPREVTTGLVGDRHMTEVLSGVSEGELVVVSGQFLIDSESQLQEAIQKMLTPRAALSPPADAENSAEKTTVWACPMHSDVISMEAGRCPVCGMDLEERSATSDELSRLDSGHTHESQGDAGDVAEYVCPMHNEIVTDEAGRCPVCGIFLEERTAAEENEE